MKSQRVCRLNLPKQHHACQLVKAPVSPPFQVFFLPRPLPTTSHLCSGPIRAEKIKHFSCCVRALQVGPVYSGRLYHCYYRPCLGQLKHTLHGRSKTKCSTVDDNSRSCSLQIILWKHFGLARNTGVIPVLPTYFFISVVKFIQSFSLI